MRLSQSEQDLTLTGTRPPSTPTSSRPGSRYGHSYTKVANVSIADEVLFSSPHRNLEEASFDAPWAKKDKRQILLWSPAPATPTDSSRPNSSRPNSSNRNTPVIKDSMLKTKRPFKLVKNRPSFVDECLFGTPLKEPSFTAPWNVKRKTPNGKSRSVLRPTNWGHVTPKTGSVPCLDLKHKSPAARTFSAPPSSGHVKPAWKP